MILGNTMVGILKFFFLLLLLVIDFLVEEKKKIKEKKGCAKLWQLWEFVCSWAPLVLGWQHKKQIERGRGD